MPDCLLAGEEARLQALHDLQILDTEPEEAFEGITRLARSALGVPIALVSLVDRDRQWFKSRHGLDDPETSRDVSFCAHAIQQNDTFVVPDARCDPRFAANPLVTGKPYIRFYAGAQLRNRDGFNLGTVCCIDTAPRAPSGEQLAILRDLARLAADEMELRRLASTDGLTGAMTRRAFLEAARRDLSLARRHGRPVACVIVDVDHFKQVNDTHGHAMGDQVLRAVVALLRAELRVSDYVGRLGGEEFALILRETGPEGAWEIAERLRRRLAAELFPGAVGPLKVTMSCGVANYDRVSSIDSLLEQADFALYQAKNRGRNCTIAYTPAARLAGSPTAIPPANDLGDSDCGMAGRPTAQVVNVRAHFRLGAWKQACTVTSHFNGVLQITADKAPPLPSEGRVTLRADAFGKIEGDAIWIDERRFVISIAPEMRASLAGLFAGLADEAMARLSTPPAAVA